MALLQAIGVARLHAEALGARLLSSGCAGARSHDALPAACSTQDWDTTGCRHTHALQTTSTGASCRSPALMPSCLSPWPSSPAAACLASCRRSGCWWQVRACRLQAAVSCDSGSWLTGVHRWGGEHSACNLWHKSPPPCTPDACHSYSAQAAWWAW